MSMFVDVAPTTLSSCRKGVSTWGRNTVPVQDRIHAKIKPRARMHECPRLAVIMGQATADSVVPPRFRGKMEIRSTGGSGRTLRKDDQMVAKHSCKNNKDATGPPSKRVLWRNNVQLVCPEWQKIVLAMAAFWSRVGIMEHSAVNRLNTWLDRANDAPLTLHMHFMDVESISCNQSSLGGEVLEDFLDEVTEELTHLPRTWAQVTVTAENEAALITVLEALGHILSLPIFCNAPLLLEPWFQELEIRPTKADALWFHLTRTDTVQMTVELPETEELRWSEITRILTESSAMEKLRVTGIEIGPLPRNPRKCQIPNLTTLDIDFQGCRSLANLLWRLEMPKLKALKFRIRAKEDLQCIMTCRHMLCRLEELHIVGSLDKTQGLNQLYTSLHHCRTLNLEEASVAFAEALLVASSKRVVGNKNNWFACPELKCLYLRKDSVNTAVAELVRIRIGSGYKPLERIMW
ncbi:hypothetical protein C8R44DRAFT_747311 [Mycena epipterygia]|nr:hypothetical protein C8R44DRAFT_747311 [Mycena epipterygia]